MRDQATATATGKAMSPALSDQAPQNPAAYSPNAVWSDALVWRLRPPLPLRHVEVVRLTCPHADENDGGDRDEEDREAGGGSCTAAPEHGDGAHRRGNDQEGMSDEREGARQAVDPARYWCRRRSNVS
jgi:hypothetical protein